MPIPTPPTPAPRTAVRRLIAAAGVVAGTAAAVLMLPAGAAVAHSAGTSALVLDAAADRVTGQLHVPADQLALATGIDVTRQPELDATTAATVRAYLSGRLGAHGSGGMWWATPGTPVRSTVDRQLYVSMPITFVPPAPGATSVTIAGDPVVREVRSHDVHVYVGATGGVLDPAGLRLAGTLDYATTTVTVEMAAPPGGAGTVRAGIVHVLDGLDHLLFVAMLLLPAPLVARHGRWRERRTARATILRTLEVVTAFTAGHTATLAAVTLTGADVASRWLEVLIAVSVAVTAVHALRPLVRSGEVWFAGAFGLVHGMAFAGLLRDLGAPDAGLWRTLLAFNVGVELAQLIVVALVLPFLLVLVDGPTYGYVRRALAVLGLIAALAWAAERAFEVTNPLAPALDWTTAHPYSVAAALAAVAAAALVTRRRRRVAVA
ncbi:HupE/UreJ family protein [Micromonosporaceae bacterium B7E4]